MSMSKGTNTYNRQNWEDSDFPILCQTCLGDNPYVRMMREQYGKECKICQRPFTVFRWCPGPRARFKKTELCQTCAKTKNVCQTCILDLNYGLPVQVRDRALKEAAAASANLPKSAVNREYFQQQVDRQIADSGDPSATYNDLGGAGGKADSAADLLLKLARTTPYYKRNRPHICSFWVKGQCNRGEECPYRHEKPTNPDDPLSEQNIKDRFFGSVDPVADKLLKKFESMPKLSPPEDRTITTLYVGSVCAGITEAHLRDHFYQFGELRSVAVLLPQSCAFVQFTTREAAERAADESFDRLIVAGRRLNIRWGRSQAHLDELGGGAGAAAAFADGSGAALSSLPLPGLPGALPMPPPGLDFFGLGGGPPPAHALTRPDLRPAPTAFMNMPPPPLPPRLPPPGAVSFGMLPPLPPGLQLLPVRSAAPSAAAEIEPLPPGIAVAPAVTPLAMRPPVLPPPVAWPSAAAGAATVPKGSDGASEDGQHAGRVHYPSQDPSRMGSKSGAT